MWGNIFWLLIPPTFQLKKKKKKKKPETSRLKELKDKKNLDNKSKAYFGLSVDFYTFLRPSWTMEMFIIGISNEE